MNRHLSTKNLVTTADKDRYFANQNGGRSLQLDGKQVPLDQSSANDKLTPAERAKIHVPAIFWNYEKSCPVVVHTPVTSDYAHSRAIPIHDQGDRQTCIAFATLGAIELFLARRGEVIHLSAQYANWIFMRAAIAPRNWCHDDVRLADALVCLSELGVCAEILCPYESLSVLRTGCDRGPSADAQHHACYGIKKYSLIDNVGRDGPSISNIVFLENIVSQGFDIIITIGAAFGRHDTDHVYDVMRDGEDMPWAPTDAHCVVIVGYERSARKPFFICRNSWGEDTGADGYLLLSYDYVRTYALYGAVVLQAATDRA